MTKDLCSSRQRTITMASVSISLLVAVAVLTGVNTVTAFDWAGNDPSLTQLATLPPPDESAIPNLMNFLNCLQPGGDPHTQLIDAVPNNDKEPLRDMFPGIGPPMAMITCDMLKQAASGAQTLIYQLATGQISPQQFIKGLMDLNPMITTLVMDIIKDAKKALDEVIKNLPPDSPLKSILQQASDFLDKVIKDPIKTLGDVVQVGLNMWNTLSPELKQYLLQAGAQIQPTIAMLSNMLTGPPPPPPQM